MPISPSPFSTSLTQESARYSWSPATSHLSFFLPIGEPEGE